MTEETKVCPFCAETIKAAAIVCRYCGRDLVPNVSSRIPQPQSTSTPSTVEFKRHPATMVIDPIKKSQMSLTIYTDRVVWKEGVLRKSETTVFLNQITDVKVSQSLAGKAAGYGDIIIQTAGSTQAEIIAEGMKNPKEIRDLIYERKSRL